MHHREESPDLLSSFRTGSVCLNLLNAKRHHPVFNSSTTAQIASVWSSPLDEGEVISSASVPDPTLRTISQPL